ncbi:acyl-CoA synthetase, partial [Sinobaca sp. H24]|uniref:acyl-CoA synthetase n=1 Tax=Sinobaca sp. H24 TaxID=2923376 RepID=UPI002079E2C6
MKREDLLAPAQYNIVNELDAYRNDDQKTAIRWMNEKKERRDVSYKTLLEKASQFAGVLLDQGIQKGDKILIIVPRLPEAYMIYLACLKIGAVAIPCSEMLRSKDLIYRLHHSEAVGIIAHHHSTEEVDAITEELPYLQFKMTIGGAVDGWLQADALAGTKEKELATADTNSSDVAFLSYTSGTTGNPKGVIHTHAWAYAHVRTAAKEWLDVRENDIVWATAAPGWQKWVWSPFLSTVMLGATAFVYNGGFKPDTYLQLLQDENIQVLCCTPTEYRLMAKVDNLGSYKLPHLR